MMNDLRGLEDGEDEEMVDTESLSTQEEESRTLKQRHWPLRKKLLTLRQQKPWSQRDLLKRKIPGRPRGRGG